MLGGVVLPLALAAARTLKKGVSLRSDRCVQTASNPRPRALAPRFRDQERLLLLAAAWAERRLRQAALLPP